MNAPRPPWPDGESLGHVQLEELLDLDPWQFRTINGAELGITLQRTAADSPMFRVVARQLVNEVEAPTLDVLEILEGRIQALEDYGPPELATLRKDAQELRTAAMEDLGRIRTWTDLVEPQVRRVADELRELRAEVARLGGWPDNGDAIAPATKPDLGAQKLMDAPAELRQAIELPVVARDPWANRSKGMKCATCMWFVRKAPDPTRAPPRRELGQGQLGRCRRRAPTMSGYPATFETDWCGDHKLDENKR